MSTPPRFPSRRGKVSSLRTRFCGCPPVLSFLPPHRHRRELSFALLPMLDRQEKVHLSSASLVFPIGTSPLAKPFYGHCLPCLSASVKKNPFPFPPSDWRVPPPLPCCNPFPYVAAQDVCSFLCRAQPCQIFFSRVRPSPPLYHLKKIKCPFPLPRFSDYSFFFERQGSCLSSLPAPVAYIEVSFFSTPFTPISPLLPFFFSVGWGFHFKPRTL